MINVVIFIHGERTCCVAELAVYGMTDFLPLLLNISAFVSFPSRICQLKILLVLKTKGEIFPICDFSLRVLSHLMLGHDWMESVQNMTGHYPNSEMASYKIGSCYEDNMEFIYSLIV